MEYHTCDLYFRAALAGDPETLRVDPDEVASLRWCTPGDVVLESLAFPSLKALWNSLRAGLFSR